MCKDVATCVLIVVNSLFLLLSIAMIVVGSLLQWGGPGILNNIVPTFAKLAGSSNNSSSITMEHISKLFSQYTSILGNAGLIIFIIGLILFVICMCGTLGVCCKSDMFMMLYLFFMVFIWILMIIFIIIFLTKRTAMQLAGGYKYKRLLKDEYEFNNGSHASSGSGLDITGIIDLIQARLHCCGGSNYKDFMNSKGYKTEYGIIPFSCCKMVGDSFTLQDSNCPMQPTLDNSYMYFGCYSYFWDIINKYSKYATYGLLGLAIVLFILIIIALVLLKGFRNKE